MGFFDALINGIIGGTHLKRYIKKSVPTDYKQKRSEIGNRFLGLVSAKEPNFFGGAIQGAQQKGDGSYWIHTFIGKRDKHYLHTIEAFANPRGVDYGTVDDYLNDNFHMLIFNFDFLTNSQWETIWSTAERFIGTAYDDIELISRVLPEELDNIFNDRNKVICASLVAISCAKIFPVVQKKIKPWRAAPGDIRDYLYPKRNIPIVKIGWE